MGEIMNIELELFELESPVFKGVMESYWKCKKCGNIFKFIHKGRACGPSWDF